jgi:hypothetical protein
MLWLKMILGYFLLTGIGVWVVYRSRQAQPSQPASTSDFQVAGPEQPVEPGAGPTTGVRG